MINNAININMWNSPRRISKKGKRYSIQDIGALIIPLESLLEHLENSSVKDLVSESILVNMENGEFIYALYEVLDMMLNHQESPEGGHFGYQEAIVAELLSQARDIVDIEIEISDPSEKMFYSSRRVCLESIQRLVVKPLLDESSEVDDIDEYFGGLSLKNLEDYKSAKLTPKRWEELILEEGGLWNEFLWDADWRLQSILDLPENEAEKLGMDMGLSLDKVQAIPKTPTEYELKKAEHYLRYLIYSLECELEK